MKKLILFSVLLTAILFSGCDDSEKKEKPCDGVTCSDHGVCNDTTGFAICDCDSGYVNQGDKECVIYSDPCANVVCENSWESCRQGTCRPISGKCNSNSDCTGGATCNTTTHTCEGGTTSPCDGVDCSGHGDCVAEGYGYGAAAHCDCDSGYSPSGLTCVPDSDPCANIQCNDWESCVEGACQINSGRCSSNTHCTSPQTCDLSTHTCISDPCAGVTCSGNGICSVEGGAAVCNCNHGFKANGTECVANTSTPGWCGIKWVGADNGDIEEAIGYSGPNNKVYGQIYVSGVTETQTQQNTIKGQLGYKTGSASTVEYPIIASEYTWVNGTFNSSCTGCGNNHEYMADFPTTTDGTYQFIFRFSTDSGSSWSYCDKAPGFITSASNMPGKAIIGNGGETCGGEICDGWESCVSNQCTPLSGRCNVSGDCGVGEVCNISAHNCEENGGAPILSLVGSPTVTSNSYSFVVQYSGDEDIDLSASQIYLNGEIVNLSSSYDSTTKKFTISASGLTPGKYSYLFRVKDSSGVRAKALFVPMWIETTAFTWKDAFIYQVMTDRFVNADTNNDAPVAGVDDDKNWKGGDFKGIIQKIQSGYFRDMGVNTLWISSPILNTDGKGKGVSDGQWYSGYHSYWPIATGWTDTNHLSGITSPIDPHFGTEAELKELIKIAHDNGIRILADFVANHIFGITNGDLASGSTSPLWDQHRNDNWFHSANSPYVCGWDQPIVCWFTSYLPDFNYSNPDVMDAVMDHAIWMIQEYDLDGFRLDAVKHMIMDFTTTIRREVNEKVVTTGIPFYMVGETFDGDAGYLNSFVGSDKLDGQFEFGWYFNVRDQILKNGSFSSLKSFADWNDTYYSWGGDLMSNFIGNHDVPRALNEASGDHGRLRLAHTVLMTSPRIPLIYQGDEFGMPGGGDPDNRRMMRFDLAGDELTTVNHFKKLGVFRKNHVATRKGTRSTCGVGNDFWIYKLTSGNDIVLVGVNKGGSEASADCGVSGSFKNLDDSTVTVSGTVTVPAGSSVVLGKVQ
ncbi:hypothetical protein JXR93_13740 [bacterium]|nr:hypothetical protein [bacterium]